MPQLACYREGINAHLTAAIACAEPSPGGAADAEPVAAASPAACWRASQLPAMMHIARELCGGQICVTPDCAAFARSGDRAVAGEVLHGQRELAGGGPAQAAGIRARPAEFGLRRPPADVRAVRAVAALRASGRGLPQLRLGGPLRVVQESAGLSDRVLAREALSMTHQRIRPFNTRDTYPSRSSTTTSARRWSRATRSTCAARWPRTWTPARTSRSAIPPAQAEQAMDNIELLLGECGSAPRRTSARSRSTDRHPLSRGRLPGARPVAAGRLPGVHRPRGVRRWPGPSGWSRST